MWKWKDLTPFGQGVIAGIVLGFLALLTIGGLSRREKNSMSDYRCKVRIIRDREITIYAKNKNEAEEKAKNLCEIGVGLPLEVHMEVLEIERMTAKKKAQERESNEIEK